MNQTEEALKLFVELKKTAFERVAEQLLDGAYATSCETLDQVKTAADIATHPDRYVLLHLTTP